MPDIKVTVRNKIAVGDGTEIVCGNSDYTVVFDFDAEWEAFDAKTMRVRFTNDTYKDVVFNGTSCILPIVQNSVGVDIGVFAGALHTTSVATFDCVKSILSGGGSPDTSEPIIDPSIIELINNKPGEKCEGKTFSVHTGELTDANILKFNSDGSFPSEQKTASADSERFNAYTERGVYQNAAIGECSTVFGSRSWVIGDGGFASGTCNLVKGLLGVAFGIGHYLYESSQKGFACGSNNRLQGILEFVSGTGNYSKGYASHVEGASNQMGGKYAHAEGAYNENYGYACHVEGRGNIADGGRGSSTGKPQHVEGQYNVQDGTQTYAHIVGNGTSKSDRSNAHTLNYNGTAWYANAVKVGGTSETDAKTLATEEFVTNAISAALYVDSETEVG